MCIGIYQASLCCYCYYKCSPYLWGKTAVDQFKERQKKGWVLCKQPGMTEVLDMLDKSRVKQSTYNFPIDISLEVCKHNVHELSLCFLMYHSLLEFMNILTMVN